MAFCSSCGAEVAPDVSFCPKCGKQLSAQTSEMSGGPTKRKSRWWYLVPIFLQIIGGIIAYLILKDDDRKLAKKLLLAWNLTYHSTNSSGYGFGNFWCHKRD